MYQHVRIPLVYVAVVATFCCQFSISAAEPTKEDVQRLRNFLDGQVRVLKANDEQLEEKLQAMNELEGIATKVVESVRADNTDSVATATESFVYYQEAIKAMDEAANAQDRVLKYTGGVFQLVEAQETAGELPKGTLSPKDAEAHKIATIHLKTIEDILAKVMPRSEELGDTLHRKTGVALRKADKVPGQVVGLDVIAHYLPSGNVKVGAPQNGFALIMNRNRTRTLSGTLRLNVGEGGRDSGPHWVSVPPGQARKINFTVTITAPGSQVSYMPTFMEDPDQK